MPYRPIPAPRQAEQIMGGINTTPLIDVMLVLLIMFIMIIPVTTHKVAVDLPQGPGEASIVTVHRLDLTAAGNVLWDGAPIARSDIPARLATIANQDSVLHFRADGNARYEDFDQLLADIKRAGIERLGLVDNARFVEQ